jgi:hypothetical protein
MPAREKNVGGAAAGGDETPAWAAAGRLRSPGGPGHSFGALPGAVVEQDGAQHGVGRGQLGRVGPAGDLAVELVDDGHDRAGIVPAGRHAPGGLYERIFLGLELFWIALAAGRLIRTAT